MSIATLIAQLRVTEGCEVYPPTDLPANASLPADLKEFYRLAGGAVLFAEAEYTIEVVPPEQLLRANPLIVGDDHPEDISHEWFVVARAGGQYITIDLSPSRCGRCYDSFWDSHGVAGSCRVISLSFESLLAQLLQNRGGYWFWLRDDFVDLGDAYD